jgi:hypothetical protein
MCGEELEMKTKWCVFLVLTVSLSFVGCDKIKQMVSGSTLSGMYENEEPSFFASLEFNKDGICYIKDGFVGLRTSYEYKVAGNTLTITGNGGTMAFEIESGTVIVGSVFPVEGNRFVKK